MYRVTVRRSFVAQHFLTVPDPGPEGEVHSHHFTAEVRFEGPDLGEYGYLVDIDAVKDAMTAVIGRYRDTTLNDHDAFEGRNPSVERFARLFAEDVAAEVPTATPESLRVTLWEDEDAAASYEITL